MERVYLLPFLIHRRLFEKHTPIPLEFLQLHRQDWGAAVAWARSDHSAAPSPQRISARVAISSFSINEINPVIDGNVYRFLSRLLGILIPINTNKSLKEFRNIAKILISKKNPSDFNQAIMEFGSLVCKPKNPICNECIYQKSCFSYLNQKTLMK